LSRLTGTLGAMPEPMRNLRRCKTLALKYVEDGELAAAVIAMAYEVQRYSDIKFTDKELHHRLMTCGLECAYNDDELGVRDWINGFS